MKTIKIDNGVFKGQVGNDGKKCGVGRTFFIDKSSYDGQWKDDRKHGFGKFNYKNGGSYEGQWGDDKKHGFGTYTFSNGDIYSGDWSGGKMSGKGIFKYKSGNLYGGEWSNGEMHGKGVYWTDGSYNLYDGEWMHNRKHGKGLMMYREANEKYNGEWADDMKHGSGCFTFKNGDVYEGQWSKGKIHGKVYMYLANGDAFETEFDNDVEVKFARRKTNKPRGPEKKIGQYVFESGELYVGELVNELPDGFGVKSLKNGDRYEGKWKKGKECGAGTFHYADGKKENAHFGDDYYHLTGGSFSDEEFQRMVRERDANIDKLTRSSTSDGKCAAPKTQEEIQRGIKQYQKLAKDLGINLTISVVQGNEQFMDIVKTMDKEIVF